MKELNILVEKIPQFNQKVGSEISGKGLVYVLHHFVAIAQVGSIDLGNEGGALHFYNLLYHHQLNVDF